MSIKKIPNQLFKNNDLSLNGECYLGINYNEITMVKDKKNPV